MDDQRGRAVSRRGLVLAAAAALASGCSGLTSGTGDGAGRTEGGTAREETEPSTPTPAEDWNATVALDASKTSMAGDRWIYNGWNVSVEVTEMTGADEVVLVVDKVNVVKGNATRTSVVGSEAGASHSRVLLQRGEVVSVYAVRDDERKRIDGITINSSYVAPVDGETAKWADGWRGDPPESESAG